MNDWIWIVLFIYHGCGDQRDRTDDRASQEIPAGARGGTGSGRPQDPDTFAESGHVVFLYHVDCVDHLAAA